MISAATKTSIKDQFRKSKDEIRNAAYIEFTETTNRFNKAEESEPVEEEKGAN